MTAFKVARLRVKSGQEQQFLDEHREGGAGFPVFRRGPRVKAGDRGCYAGGVWDGSDSINAARGEMIAMLDRFPDRLVGLGGTDPVYPRVVFGLGA